TKNLKPEDERQFVDLLEASLQESDEILLKLFRLDRKIKLDVDWVDEKKNDVYLNLVKRLLQADPSLLESIQEKICFTVGDNEVPLKSIDSANDRVVVEHQNQQINLSRSLILNLEDNNSLAAIQNFALEAIEKNILTEKEA